MYVVCGGGAHVPHTVCTWKAKDNLSQFSVLTMWVYNQNSGYQTW